jgi:hypothetical protein
MIAHDRVSTEFNGKRLRCMVKLVFKPLAPVFGKRQVIDLLVKITQLGEAQRRDARYYNFATYH